MKNHLLFSTVFFLILYACGFQNKWAKELNWKYLDFNDLPGAQEYPDAAAIVLLDEGFVDVVGSSETGYTIYERHRVIRILNNAGFTYANISIPYGSNSIVENIRARTIDEDGSIRVLKDDNIYDVNLYPNFMFYSDQRAKIFTMPAITKNCILEYRYNVLIPGKTIVSSWSFQENIPTLHSSFKLVVPSTWELNYKTNGMVLEPEIIEAPNGFKSTYTWKTGMVPSVNSEFGMPPQREVSAWLNIAPPGIKTWKDVGDWYYGLTEPRMNADKAIIDKVNEIVREKKTDEEKLKAIYAWVRSRIRYISVAIGIGGFQPHEAADIFQKSYGDCKDMSALLCTMADAAGIETKQVLISTRQNGIPDTSVASPYHFNHVIVYAPSTGVNGIWMDATEKGVPFGALPWYDQGLPALVVDAEGKSFMTVTPAIPPEQNNTKLEWYVTLGRKGQVSVEGKTVYTGAMAGEMREDLSTATRSERRSWFERYIADHAAGGELDTFFVTGLDTVRDPLVLHYRFHAESFASRHGDTMILRPADFFRMELPYYFTSDEREHPVRFRFGLRRSFVMYIVYPPNWMVASENRSEKETSGFGEASWEWGATQDYLYYKTDYLLNGKDINKDDYPEFRRFLKRVQKQDRKELLLRRKRQQFP